MEFDVSLGGRAGRMFRVYSVRLSIEEAFWGGMCHIGIVSDRIGSYSTCSIRAEEFSFGIRMMPNQKLEHLHHVV